MLLIICIVLFLIFALNFSRTRNAIALTSMFLTTTFYGSYQLLEKTRNYIYFTFSIIFTALITGAFLQQYGALDLTLYNIQVLLFIVCLASYTSLILLAYHLKQNNLNEPPQGEKGKNGLEGQPGKMRI